MNEEMPTTTSAMTSAEIEAMVEDIVFRDWLNYEAETQQLMHDYYNQAW